jgi:hypothetical protein
MPHGIQHDRGTQSVVKVRYFARTLTFETHEFHASALGLLTKTFSHQESP